MACSRKVMMSRYATKCSDVLFKMLEKGKLHLHFNVCHCTLLPSSTQAFMKLIDWSTRTDASKMHMSNSLVRTLPAEVYSAMPQSQILNSDPNSVHDLPGALPPLSVPATGLVPATSEVKHLPRHHPSNSMRICAKEFCKHQKAIRSHNDCVLWFSSMDSEPIGALSSSPKCYSHALQDGDLFIHTHSHGHQAWIWGEPSWMPVQEGQSHPYIMGYYLSIAGSGEPSWVMGKTMSTYRVKNRKCRP
ncbi:hypothetical protein BKA83DRAFT_4131669 [Pisolithus microcarpus]|nr:hypothetical protein BKA83DRAFT_4131669 [Pisolithus microcarpus]